MRYLIRPLQFGAVLLLGALPAQAQIRASEPAIASQTIDGTTVTVEYSRPRVRGRPVMFGERRKSIVHWGEVWTPGANWATTLEVSKPITLSGRAIPKGKYSMWLIPAERGAWTMALDPRPRLFHMVMPDSTPDQIRFPVQPGTGAHEEALTFAFTDIMATGTTLELRWGTMRVAMPVKVVPTLRMTTPVAEAERFAGRYDWRFTEDSAQAYSLVLGAEDGYLMGRLKPDTWPPDFAFVKVHPTRDWYSIALFDKGEIYEVETTWVAEFTRGADGKVTGFVIREDSDKIMVRARRLP